MGKSTIFAAAAAAMTFSGVASAYNFGNGTVNGTLSSAYPVPTAKVNTTMSSGLPTKASTSSVRLPTGSAAAARDPIFCPNLDGRVFIGPLEVDYAIKCGVNNAGVVINIDITLAKRQAATFTSLQDCIDLCDPLAACVGTSFNTNTGVCTLFSGLGGEFNDPGSELAVKIPKSASSTASAGFPTATPTGGMYGNGTFNNGTMGSGPMGNGSMNNGTTPNNGTRGSIESLLCPALDAQVYSDSNGVEYIIECGRNHVGVIFGTQRIAKRQVAATEPSLLECMELCDAQASCVGTAFDVSANSCTFFSSVGAAYNDENVDFAIRVAPATTATAGQLLTSTVYSTNVRTISSCAPTVTNCPLNAGGVVTQVIPVSETVYVCPTATVIPGAVVACSSCPYAAVSASVYSTTVMTISSCAPTMTNCPLNAQTTVATITTMVPGVATVVNYPVPTNTIVSTLSAVPATGTVTVPGAGSGAATRAGSATGSANASKTSGLVAFTGAANALSAGMGMAAAAVAGAVFIL